MARPRRFRRISEEPQIRCFKPEREDLDNINPIEILIDEFEAIRLRDYHDIQQKISGNNGCFSAHISSYFSFCTEKNS